LDFKLGRDNTYLSFFRGLEAIKGFSVVGVCMRVVGVTGVFGAGKSTALKFFSLFFPCLDLDEVVDRLYGKKGIQRKLKKLFGTADKKKLAETVFSFSLQRKKLEECLLPFVFSEFRKEVRNLEKKGARVLVVEAPILFEAGWKKFFDKIVVVSCPQKKILERLQRKGVPRKEIFLRWKNQFSLKKKLLQADHVLDNSKTLSFTKKQVFLLVKKLKEAP
jgi:dephospho-CoA kinase